MNIGQELLNLPKYTKFRDWVPGSAIKEKERRERISETRKLNSPTNAFLNQLISVMGDKVWNVAELTVITGWAHHCVRDRLCMLIERKKAARSIHGQPYKYWVINKD